MIAAACQVVVRKAVLALAVLVALGLVGAPRATAEEQILTGWLAVRTIHPLVGPAVTEYWLTDDRGVRTALVIDASLLAAHGGPRGLDRRRVTVTGDLVSGASAGASALLVRSIQVAPRDESALRSMEATAAAAVATQTRRWVTILCRFADSANVTPHDVSWFEGLVTSNAYPSMAHYWQEVSYGAVSLEGSVVTPWYTLPHPRSTYVSGGGLDLDRLADDCTAAAEGDVHFPTYFGINLMFNGDLPVSVGGTWVLFRDGVSRFYAVTWIARWGYEDQGVLAHEMGHGFGFPHSSGPYSATYDSRWDVMSDPLGVCREPHASYGCVGPGTIAHHKHLVGWIPPARRFVAGAGTLATIALDWLGQPADSSSLLMATIPIGGSATRFYTVEARDLVGYDREVPGRAVIIHDVDTTRDDREARVVDIDGNGKPNDAGAMWLPGETFSDVANAISVHVVSETVSGFLVMIANNAGPLPGVGASVDT